MKVTVYYYGICSEEVEVDEKFTDTLPAFERGDDDTYVSLTEELYQTLDRQVGGDIHSISDADGNTLFEV